jgi:hypothetical protein
MALAAFDGHLYAGTWSTDLEDHGAEIWRSSTGNGGSWTRMAGDAVFGEGDNVAIMSFAAFGDQLYAATANGETGGEVWRTGDGGAWTQANVDGFGDADNTYVSSLEVFDGQLYAGTHNDEAGGEIWRTPDGTGWERVVSGGFDGEDNRRIASLAAFDGGLYAVVANFDTGPEVWRSSSGDEGGWEKVTDIGFGGGRSTTVYWDNVAAVLGGELYVGTTTSGNGGGRVWRRAASELAFGAGITKSVAPEGQVAYGDALTYTVVISAAPGTETVLYDPLLGTSFDRFLVQPEGVEHADGAITGTLQVAPTGRMTVSFVAQVDVPAVPGLAGSVTNRACVRPVGSTLADCVWSKDVANTLSQAGSSWSCLPRYGELELILTTDDTSLSGDAEPFVTSGDFNGDGLDDFVITGLQFQTYETWELAIVLNDGNGGLVLATPGIFSGTIPAVQHPREVVVADFNGDEVDDIFVADHGYDAPPFPGYPNTLVLSLPGGRLVDASANLPQQGDYTHAAAAGDIDRDGDNDLYLGQLWEQSPIDPQILLNDGSGAFTVAEGRLHESLSLELNGYTRAEFVDVNNDGFPDLVLGDAAHATLHTTEGSVVLMNDGLGRFISPPIVLPMEPPPVPNAFTATDIQPIDLNRDGYQDLLIAYAREAGRYIQVLINNHDGTFRDETSARLPQSDNDDLWIYETWLRDIDRDGDLDYLARHLDWREPDPLLYLNDGSGYFSHQPMHFGVGYLYHTFLDLDGDGGHDLINPHIDPAVHVYAIRDLGCPVFLPMVCRER